MSQKENYQVVSASLKEIQPLKREGKFSNAIQIIDEILSNFAPIQKRTQIELLYERSNCYRLMGNFEEAEKSATEALILVKQSPVILKEKGLINLELGQIYFNLLSVDRSEISFQKAKAIFSEIGMKRGLAISLSYLGLNCYFRGELDEAEQLSKEGLEIIIEFGSNEEISASKIIRGIVYMTRGELQHSKTLFQESIALSETSAYQGNLAWALYNLGYIYFLQGENQSSENALRRSVGLLEKYEVQISTRFIVARYILILTLLTQNLLDEAKVEVDKLGNLADNSPLPLARGYHHLSSGQLKLLQHDLGSALNLGFRAKRILDTISYLSGQILTLKFLMQAHLRLYLSTRQEELKNRIVSLMEELEELSKQEAYQSNYIEAIITRGFLKRVEFDLSGANEQFELAETLANKYGLHGLARRAHTEASQLRAQTAVLQRRMTQSPEDYEQMQMTDLLAYLEGAQKIVGGRKKTI